ncbi:MAG: CDP-alcohol phosphatidyltransferase family protein [Eubacteriales bacterium]
MKRERICKHILHIADMITLSRIAGTLILAILPPLSAVFLCVFALTGLTDALDGWVARKAHTQSDFGARLDSIADLLFYAVMLLRLFPSLWRTLPVGIWYAVAAIMLIRLSAYLTAAVKYRRFASLHTYLNKLSGLTVFCIPFLLRTPLAVVYCYTVCAVAAVAALEELVMHLHSPDYDADRRSILQKHPSHQKNGAKTKDAG